MKHFSIILTAVVTIGLFGACKYSPAGKWPELPPEAEAICDTLEILYANDQAVAQGAHLVDRLEKVAHAEKNSAAHARVLYWKSVVAHPNSDSLYTWLDEAKNLTDSTAYPYMYARLSLIDGRFDRTSYFRRHTELRHAIRQFRQAGDMMMELQAYRTLSSFFLRIGDYDGFHECADAAALLCHEMGKDSLLAKNKINYVLSYTHSGDTLKATKILDELLKDRYIRSDSDFMGRIYVNLGNLTSDPDYYQKAIDISPTFRTTPDMRQTLEFAKLKTYEANGDFHRADSLLAILQPIVETDGDYMAKGIMHNMLSRQAKDRGDFRRALQETEYARKYLDSTYTSDDRMKVSLTNFKEEIALQEAEHRHESQLSNTRLWAMTAVLLLFCLLMWLYYKNRQHKLLMRHYAAEAEVAKLNLDLEKEKRNIVAIGVAMTERNNLIKDVVDIADRMHSDGTISTDAKNTISRMVKISQASQDEWDNFKITYTRVHPHFIKKLKEAYPEISEGDTRLALYICAGLTTKQIALAMHLQPDSVKKNRQRLRQRMKITSDVSLEEELRKFL